MGLSKSRLSKQVIRRGGGRWLLSGALEDSRHGEGGGRRLSFEMVPGYLCMARSLHTYTYRFRDTYFV